MSKCKTETCKYDRVGDSQYCEFHRALAHKAWVERIRADKTKREGRSVEFKALYEKALAAGKQAAASCIPVPMIVEQHANMADDSSPVVQRYHEPEGVCGFAWVVIRPANSAFAHWLKKNTDGNAKSGYGGGLHYWISGYGQSMTRKEAFAKAFAKVLREEGLIKAFPESRMD